ncbi:MAG: family 16 glycosylhydrolase [Corynebacterium sp.]|nr:family 16 glycosylhydrolase [Corynebacterium sp.]
MIVQVSKVVLALTAAAALCASHLAVSASPAHAENQISSEKVSPIMREILSRDPHLVRFEPTSSDFNLPIDQDPTIAQWQIFNGRESYRNPIAWWLQDNITVENGVMSHHIKRYCVDAGTTITPGTYAGLTAQSEPCPAGKDSIYSVSRMHLPEIPAGNFKVSIRARATGDIAINGVRRNLWMQNDVASNHPEYVELDLVEAYSSRPKYQYSATHLAKNAYKDQRMPLAEENWNKWHTWTVELFDGHLAYYLDGQLIGDRVRGFDNSIAADASLAPIYDQMLARPFKLIVDTMVENPAKDAWLAPPEEDKPFGEQSFEIDYIHTYVEPNPPAAAAQCINQDASEKWQNSSTSAPAILGPYEAHPDCIQEKPQPPAPEDPEEPEDPAVPEKPVPEKPASGNPDPGNPEDPESSEAPEQPEPPATSPGAGVIERVTTNNNTTTHNNTTNNNSVEKHTVEHHHYYYYAPAPAASSERLTLWQLIGRFFSWLGFFLGITKG